VQAAPEAGPGSDHNDRVVHPPLEDVVQAVPTDAEGMECVPGEQHPGEREARQNPAAVATAREPERAPPLARPTSSITAMPLIAPRLGRGAITQQEDSARLHAGVLSKSISVPSPELEAALDLVRRPKPGGRAPWQQRTRGRRHSSRSTSSSS
jgi:hypothetical protein